MLNENEINEVRIRIAEAQRMLIQLQDVYPNTEISKEAYDIQTVLGYANAVIDRYKHYDAGKKLSRRFERNAPLADKYPTKRYY